MSNTVKLKEAYDLELKFGAFYTGGHIEWHEENLFCHTQNSINVLNIEDGKINKIIEEDNDEDSDYIQTFTTNNIDKIITSHKSGLLREWELNGKLIKSWKYIHKGPIAKLTLNGTRLASGGSDGIVRIWDLKHQACTNSFKDCQGVINVLEWFINDDNDEIFASGDNGDIISWSIVNNQLLYQYKGHYSKVTSLEFFNDKFVTCGRDNVIILWTIDSDKPLKIIPALESIETIVKLPKKFKLPNFTSDSDKIYVASGGEYGLVRIWDVEDAKEIYKQSDTLISKPGEGLTAITKLLFNRKKKALGVISFDQNIFLYHLKSFACLKQFVGFADEILDIVFIGENDSHIAVATNSADIKIYENNSLNCQLIKGHTDIVLALASAPTNPNLLLSSSKDNQIRLWYIQSSFVRCLGVGIRHVASVGTITFSQSSLTFFVSASQDTCVKLWEIPKNLQDLSSTNSLVCLYTEVAHEKDINCVAVSPNDKYIATASQDKSIKLWTSDLKLIGVLKGHKRGVWCVRFSPVDQVILSSSADCTIKLWSVADLICLKTLEGHESSVIRAEFISNGMQIISTGGDGFIKIFSIKTSECQTTLDQHSGRVWALALNKNEDILVTGGEDSLLIKWKDVSEEKQLERRKEREQLELEEQKLRNYLQANNFLKALKLSLKLDKPLKTFKIVEILIKTGDSGLTDVIGKLNNDQKENLLKMASVWNMNSKNAQVAQSIINILLKEIQRGEFKPVNIKQFLEGTIPYTERHSNRLKGLMKDLYLIDFTINCMKPHLKNL